MSGFLRRLIAAVHNEDGYGSIAMVLGLSSTVVAGSALATVLLEVDLEAADQLKATMLQALERTSTTLSVAGGVVVTDADGDGVLAAGDTVTFGLALGPGSPPVALGEGSSVVVSLTASAHVPSAAYTVHWLTGEGPYLDEGELVELSVTVPDGVELLPSSMLTIEVISDLGSLAFVQRRLPGYVEAVSYLH
jgi:archaellin